MFISFTHPFYLGFLFVIPFLIFFHFFGLKTILGKALRFANFEAISRIKGVDLYSRNFSLLIFDIVFVVLLVFALSGFTLHTEVKASSFSYIIAIDSSESMSATDLSPDRISVAKETAINFVETLPYDSPIGVISFSGNSVIEQELTNNDQEIRFAIENIILSGVGGTDVYEAVLVSIGLLKGEKSKAIILLSDGQINTGNIFETIGYAKENHVLIHSIAIGTAEGGETSYGISKLDEESLKSIAYNTGGKFFNAGNREEVEKSFSEILQVTERLGEVNLAPYLIIFSIILFVLKGFLVSVNKILW